MSPLRTSLIAVAFVSLVAGCQSSASKGSAGAITEKTEWHTYGEAVEFDESDDVSFAALKGGEQDVWVTGVITEVCMHQGCWIRLNDPSDRAAGDLFVRTRDHAYLVPRNAHGHKVMIHGDTEYSELSVSDLRHYAEEAGKSQAEIAAISQPKTMITFHADTIIIEGPGLDKPAE